MTPLNSYSLHLISTNQIRLSSWVTKVDMIELVCLVISPYIMNQIPYPQGEGVGQAEFGNVPGPERLEVVGEADLAPSVHLRCLPVQLGECDFGGCQLIG